MLEAPLPVDFLLGPQRRELGIDERHGDDRGLLVIRRGVLLHAGDEDAEALVHLRGGQADAVVLAHRVDQIVDQSLDLRRFEFGTVERARPLAQDGMSQARDLQDGHDG